MKKVLSLLLVAGCSSNDERATQINASEISSGNQTNKVSFSDTKTIGTLSQASDSKSLKSEFRAGVHVEELYKQDLGESYYSTWAGRLERHDGEWRDVYVETNEKLVEKGILSFRCNENAGSPVGWVSYGTEDFGDAAGRSMIKIQASDWDKWRSDDIIDRDGNPVSTPPYELYVTARSRYC